MGVTVNGLRPGTAGLSTKPCDGISIGFSSSVQGAAWSLDVAASWGAGYLAIGTFDTIPITFPRRAFLVGCAFAPGATEYRVTARMLGELQPADAVIELFACPGDARAPMVAGPSAFLREWSNVRTAPFGTAAIQIAARPCVMKSADFENAYAIAASVELGFYDRLAAPVAGATLPEMGIIAGANSSKHETWEDGIEFRNGLWVAANTRLADVLAFPVDNLGKCAVRFK